MELFEIMSRSHLEEWWKIYSFVIFEQGIRDIA